jgi:hypothetical protein
VVADPFLNKGSRAGVQTSYRTEAGRAELIFKVVAEGSPEADLRTDAMWRKAITLKEAGLVIGVKKEGRDERSSKIDNLFRTARIES